MKYRFLIVDTDHNVYGTNNFEEAFEQSKWDDIAVIDTTTGEWVRKNLKAGVVPEVKGWTAEDEDDAS